MKFRILLILLLPLVLDLRAQTVVADSLPSMFQRWDSRLGELNCEDPEIVSLHYLFLQDILKEMGKVEPQLNRTLASSPRTDFYAVKREFLRVHSKAQRMKETFAERKAMVDHEFYLRAVEEMAYQDTSSAMYHLERALQYNPHNPDALLLKCKILKAIGLRLTRLENLCINSIYGINLLPFYNYYCPKYLNNSTKDIIIPI